MKQLFSILLLVATMLLAACGGQHKHGEQQFAGKFTDEFGNHFVLNTDYTGTIQFAGNEKLDSITWFDGDDHKSIFATIKYNGDPTYYFLRDGYLYRHREDMQSGHCAISIEYEQE